MPRRPPAAVAGEQDVACGEAPPMQHVESWSATKFEHRRGTWRASRNRRYMRPASRLIGDLVAAWYQERLSRNALGDLLDLGCGDVPLYGLYRDRVSSVTCVDWADSPLAVRHVDHLFDLNEPIPLAGESFDTVVLSDVLEHLYEPKRALREVGRLLRPGGLLLMNVPFMYGLHGQPHDHFRYTRFSLGKMLSEAGLRVELIEEVGGGPDILYDLVARFLSGVPVVGQPAAGVLHSFWSSMRRLRPLRYAVNKTRGVIPYGYVAQAEKPRGPLAAAPVDERLQ